MHIVIGRQKHDVRERIELENMKQSKQYTIGGPTIARLHDHVLRPEQSQSRPPMALVLPRDDCTNLLLWHDALRSLQSFLQQRGAAVQGAELLWYGIAVVVGGERRKSRSLAGC
jgi:hypothetical protein